MLDIKSISTGLVQREDGIWYSTDTENISYPTEGNDACLEIEDSSFWFKHRNNCIVSIVNAYPPAANETIFDIGGGNGFVASELMRLGRKVALVEPGQSGAYQAKKRGIEDVICATTNTAKFKAGTLSAVGLFDVVEHIEDDVAFLSSLKSLIADNGYVYLTVPSYQFLWSEDDVLAGHYRRYTLSAIAKALEKSGFEVVFSSYIFRFLPLPIFFMRTLLYKLGLSKKQKTRQNDEKEHIVQEGVVKKVLNFLLHPEVDNLSKQRQMKFGGSCIVVAKNTVSP